MCLRLAGTTGIFLGRNEVNKQGSSSEVTSEGSEERGRKSGVSMPPDRVGRHRAGGFCWKMKLIRSMAELPAHTLTLLHPLHAPGNGL